VGLLPLILIFPVLLAVGYNDLRHMRIPNVLSILAVIIFVATAFLLPVNEIGFRIAASLATLVIGFVAFTLRIFGGGDIKILAALMLFIPSQTLALFGFIFSISILVGIGLVMTLRTAPGAQKSSWKSLQAKAKFPMGISISLAGLAHPFLVSALQL
jgi:prepilin peptidase CpaA